MKTPGAILFDLGDTVLHDIGYEPEKGNYQLFSSIQNKREIQYEAIIKYVKKLNSDILPRINSSFIEFSWISFSRLLYENFRLELPCTYEKAEKKFWKLSIHMEPAPRISETLEYLQKRNIPTGVVSNSAFSGKILEEELEKHGLWKYFKFLISSADYGLRKPHPFLFELAASKMAFLPEDIWFIGNDVQCDVEGSRRAGMIPFHYIGKTGKSELPGEQTIKSWDELISRIELTD